MLFKEEVNYALVINQREIRHMKKECLGIDDVIWFVEDLDILIVNFDKVRYTFYNNSQSVTI